MGTLSQQEANKQIGRLRKPNGMHQPTWLLMKALLRELVRYMPDIHPGQRALAERLHTSQSALQRLVVRAEELGWIERSEHIYGGKPRAGTSYRLAFLPTQLVTHLAPVSGSEKMSPSGTEEPQTSSEVVVWFAPRAPSARRNMYLGYCGVCTHPVRPFDGILHGHRPRHRQCQSGAPDWPRLKEYLMSAFRNEYGNPAQWGAAFGEDPEAPLPAYKPPPAKPQARLAKRFEHEWNTVLTKHRKEWRGMYRGIDLGPAIGYIKTKFLDAGYNEEHIELMIDEFFIDLINPECELMMKDGQTCWQLFTGWWGRNPVEDPVPIRRQRERLDALNEAVARHISAIAKPAPIPPRRRVLTKP